jgi:hypothetical protein
MTEMNREHSEAQVGRNLSYEPPAVVPLGTIEELTLMAKPGSKSDGTSEPKA